MAISLPQLICHELQTGVDENGAGLCSSGGNAEKVLLETLHDAVARNRAAGKDMQDLAATSLTSHRCMTAYSLYAKTLQEEVQTAGIEDIGSMDDAAKFAEYASRIWCLIHNMSINRIWKPGFGYLDFYRNWQEGSLLSSAHEVHGICEASLGQLPPAPITLVEDVAAVLDPLTQLYTSITYCIQQQENIAIQSQVQLVASDWTEWLSKSSDCYEYIVGLAKLGCFSLQGPCATLLRTLVELCQEYDGFYDDMTQNSNNVYARFSIWRTKIKEVYSSVHIVEDSNVSHNQLKQEVDSTPLSSLMNASILVLDILSVSEALVDHNTLQWHEFLAMYCSYVEPGMLEGRMSKILSGSDSLFQHLRMQESDMCELPEEEKLIIMVLRGEILNVINHMSGFGVPGLVPHLLEIISSSLVGNPEHEIHNVRDRSFSSYSSDLMTVTPHHWQKAFDYALWAGQEGLPILLNSLPHLQLNSNGIDCLTSMYELWKPLDTDGLIRTAIQDCVCLHGHTLFRRGLIVEGMRRLLQAADYCSLEQYLIDIIHTWSLRVLRSEKKPGLGERDWMNSPILSLAEALLTKHLFNWPSASAVGTKAESVLGRPAVTFLQVLSLTPLISKVTSAFREQRTEDLRSATLDIVTDEASPPLLKFATFHLISPLLEDDSTCYFSGETIGRLACTLEDCTNIVNRDYYEEGIDEAVGDLHFALVKASCKAICSTSPDTHGHTSLH